MSTIKTTAKAFRNALLDSIRPPASRKKKAEIPILNYARIVDNTMYTTDLDRFTEIKYDATGDLDICVPYRRCLDIIHGWEGPLTIEGHDKNVRLKIGGFTFTLESKSPENFPTFPPTADPFLLIDDKIFRKMLHRTRFAITNEESRYTLNGVLLNVSIGTMTIVATDGHRLSMVEEPIGDNETKLRTLLHGSVLSWLATRADAPFSMSAVNEAGFQTFRVGGKTMMARPMSGSYPNYEAVIPKDSPISIEFASAKDLFMTVTRVARCADKRSRSTTWKFGEESNISARSDEVSVEGPLECTASAALTIGFSADYLLDFLKRAGNNPVTMRFKDAHSAGLITLDNWKYLLMPMRI